MLETFHPFEARPSSFAGSSALEAHFIAVAFNSARGNRAVLITEIMFGTTRSFHSRRMRRALRTLETFPGLWTLCSFAALHPLSPLKALIAIAWSAAAHILETARMILIRPGERFDCIGELLAVDHPITILIHR
jgi:hypothetical protein